MSRTAALSHPAAVKHSLVPTAVVFLLVSGFSWNGDAWLLVRMKIMAEDAFTFGSSERPLLLLEDGDELRTYSPSRIAGFLSFPAERIRSVAFLSLAEREEDRNADHWVGIAPRLLQAFANEDDEVVRECARAAVLNLPCVPAQDVEAVAAFVEELPPSRDPDGVIRGSLLSKVVAADPELGSWAKQFRERSPTSPCNGIELVNRAPPGESEIERRLREAVRP